ncbi:transcription antitermination protein NusG [Candidatus Magnetobacterium bavaricum]|uniref:Transcription antitermination protein NusG n=1 Tax=Candidatus Magnetobacterium bavaricum TaxID=29290 RepID=A0A0F3GHE8_9BACT|nr:transcription antitermination protein NusG [Candidatus Magnetobacterium bavaricum]
MEVTSLNWYVIHVRSRHEFKVYERLSKVGVVVFLATVERLQKWKGRKKKLSFPLFPGYLFVNIHKTHEEMLAVLHTYGVVRFLSTAPGEPEPVHEGQIVSLKRLVDSKEAIDPYPYLKKGQRVRIKKGPLTGVEGFLVEREGYHILILSIDMLCKGVSLKIDVSDVESA